MYVKYHKTASDCTNPNYFPICNHQTVRAFLPGMLKRRKGHIVEISSIACKYTGGIALLNLLYRSLDSLPLHYFESTSGCRTQKVLHVTLEGDPTGTMRRIT